MTEAEREAEEDEYRDLIGSMREGNIFIAADEVEHYDAARTVRVRDGVLSVSDGPAVEADEFLTGYFLIEAESFDAAIGWARRSRMRGVDRSRFGRSWKDSARESASSTPAWREPPRAGPNARALRERVGIRHAVPPDDGQLRSAQAITLADMPVWAASVHSCLGGGSSCGSVASYFVSRGHRNRSDGRGRAGAASISAPTSGRSTAPTGDGPGSCPAFRTRGSPRTGSPAGSRGRGR